MKKKLAALVIAIVGVLAVCDLTVFEQSHLKPVIEQVETKARELFQDKAEAEAQAEETQTEAPTSQPAEKTE